MLSGIKIKNKRDENQLEPKMLIIDLKQEDKNILLKAKYQLQRWLQVLKILDLLLKIKMLLENKLKIQKKLRKNQLQ